jgi:hypothetical protein
LTRFRAPANKEVHGLGTEGNDGWTAYGFFIGRNK